MAGGLLGPQLGLLLNAAVLAWGKAATAPPRPALLAQRRGEHDRLPQLQADADVSFMEKRQTNG